MIIRHQISLTDATGGEDGPRTHDLLNAIQTLFQTELQPHIKYQSENYSLAGGPYPAVLVGN